ncbi:DUF6020 family protein [Adlercreutzia caecimuris]|uniref:DUF6020 family protein n=1 Tax=Adlercreutzia caecimuris TaxID=671266 RepID=UPI001C3E2886|nr:DUF6020 family protein [Adlercreutzia caecimuris]
MKSNFRNLPRSRILHFIIEALSIISCWICATFTAQYLKMEPEPLFRFAVFLLLFSVVVVAPNKFLRPSQLPCRTKSSAFVFFLFGVFSFVFAVSMVLGYHIQIIIEVGTIQDDFISSYGKRDVVALVAIWLTSYALSIGLFSATVRTVWFIRQKILQSENEESRASACQPFIQRIIALGVLIFLLWVPYLLSFWPGLILSDTARSIAQALGSEALSNHHPVAYTLFIQTCIEFGEAVGMGASGGMAIYSIVQMAVLSTCLAYSILWITNRLLVPFKWAIFIAVVFGAMPYFATYSIAGWKDPIFSMALLVTTIQLAEFAGHDPSHSQEKPNAPVFFLALLISCFTRNNGVFICMLIMLFLLLLLHHNRKRNRPLRTSVKFLSSCVIVAVIVCTVTGPIYKSLNIESPKAESYGVLLSQMARTAATGGDMTEDDKSYLNELLPLELYSKLYNPTKIDSVKCDPSFNAEKLNDDFFGHWLSMFSKNPLTFFEAWELETFGFWAVNVPIVNNNQFNISKGGTPMNYTEIEFYQTEMNDAGIEFQNFLGDDLRSDLLPTDEWSIPLAWIFWGVVFLACYLVCLSRIKWILVLLPCLGLFFTLFVAAPMYYWPRYGAYIHFALPLLAAIPLFAQFDISGYSAIQPQQRATYQR